jgi:tetratricopeptide (TPR) repeat protein
MSLPPILGELAEIRGALTADRRGQIHATVKEFEGAADEAAAVAVAVTELSRAGTALGFEALHRLEVKGPRRTTLTAVRDDLFLLADLDPVKRLGRASETLEAWQRGEVVRSTGELRGSSGLTGVLPAAEPPSTAPPRPLPAATASGTRPAALDDPWCSLRRALVRGQLTRAAAFQQAIVDAGPSPVPVPGGEPLSPEALQVAMQRLLEGIGGIMSGDPMGGARSLSELAREAQPNLSIRWLAHHWSARAALQGGGAETARDHIRDTLALSRQLDVEARGVSQLLAAELLARGGDLTKALTWLAEARGRFERVADRWGLGQSWLAEARILVGRDEAASVAAARRAQETDPAWDEPQVFLAGRALTAGDPAAARAALGEVRSPAADRLRMLLEAVSRQQISLPDAGEFLRIHHAPPSGPNLRSMERIANSAPRFFQAREALAWLLVKLGRYAAAREIFEWLLKQPLAPADQALVTLGLSCTATALQAAASASGAASAPGAATGGQPGTPPALGDSALLPQGNRAGVSGLDAMFSGRLSVFSPPDLVEFLRTAGRSGLLVCSSQGGMGAFRFRKGRITGAAAPSTPSVGELLVRGGLLTAEGLASAGPAREGALVDAELIGRLVELRLVEAAAVREASRQQIEQALRELIDWTDGEFAFTREEEEPQAGEATIELDAQQLLLEIFRERDESSRGPVPGTRA